MPGAPKTEAENWEARADWFFKNISEEMKEKEKIADEVCLGVRASSLSVWCWQLRVAAQMNSGGLDRGGYWAMAEMMQAQMNQNEIEDDSKSKKKG